MAEVRRPLCEKLNPDANPQYQPNVNQIHLVPGSRSFGMELQDVLTCLHDGHKIPVKMLKDTITGILTELPVSESKQLIAQVPQGIAQDVQEAERAHYASYCKACVVMCRRAIQLSLVEKGIGDRALSAMIEEAKNQGFIKSDRLYTQAMGIKDYGDDGAH